MVHAALAAKSARGAGHRRSNSQFTAAKDTNPKLPNAAPPELTAAASVPRWPAGRPARAFFFSSCLATSVAEAGKMAGKARNRPPTTGPNRCAIKPAATVIAPPSTKRSAYSRQPVRGSADASTWIIAAPLPKDRKPLQTRSKDRTRSRRPDSRDVFSWRGRRPRRKCRVRRLRRS